MPATPAEGEPTGAYATIAELDATPGAPTGLDAAAKTKLLRAASVAVDRLAGPWTTEDNGLKFGNPLVANEKGLVDYQRDALARATCQQAIHARALDTATLVDPRVASTSGPDFSVTYRDPDKAAVPSTLSSEARSILATAHLIRTTAIPLS